MFKDTIHPGDRFESNKWGPFTIIEYFGSKDILIEFSNTGNQRIIDVQRVRNGQVCDTVERERLRAEFAAKKRAKPVYVVDSVEHGVFEASDYKEIAEQVGCSLFTIYKYMKGGKRSSYFNSITIK